MRIDYHKRAIKESLDMIKESIEVGLIERQRTIGFHCSVASADILELYLHSKNLVDPGTNIKHDFFSSEKRAFEKITVDFENKEKIIKLIVEIEKARNLLCYGRGQTREYIEKYLEIFNRLRSLFDSMGVEYE